MSEGATPLVTHAEVVSELRELVRKAFGELSDRQLAERTPRLSAIAQSLGTTSGLRLLITGAISECPRADWRRAATLLFGLDSTTAGLKLPIRQADAGAALDPGIAGSTFRQGEKYQTAILDTIAESICNFAGVPRGLGATKRDKRLVHRPELAQAIEADVSAHPKVLVWGEPGVGKSVAALEFVRTSRFQPSVRLRLHDEVLLHQDLQSALLLCGRPARSWTLSACVLEFKDVIQTSGQIALILLDNLSDTAELERLGMIGSLNSRILATSRTRLDGFEGIVEVTSLTDPELQGFLRSHHGGARFAEDEGFISLARALGNRVLAVEHALAYLAVVEDASPKSLLRAVEEDMSNTLKAIASRIGVSPKVVAFYAQVVETLSGEPLSLELLDLYLWTSSAGQLSAQNLRAWLPLLGSKPSTTVRLEAAWDQFERLGFVREDPAVSESFSMHILTWRILRDLRQSQGIGILPRLRQVMLDAAADDRHSILGHHGYVLKHSERLAKKVGVEPIHSGLCLGRYVWLLFERDSEGELNPVVVEILESGLYEVGVSGRRALGGDRLQMVYLFALHFRDFNYWVTANTFRELGMPMPPMAPPAPAHVPPDAPPVPAVMSPDDFERWWVE